MLWILLLGIIVGLIVIIITKEIEIPLLVFCIFIGIALGVSCGVGCIELDYNSYYVKYLEETNELVATTDKSKPKLTVHVYPSPFTYFPKEEYNFYGTINGTFYSKKSKNIDEIKKYCKEVYSKDTVKKW